MPTLEQIQARLKTLKAQEETLIAKRNQSILTEIRKLMDVHGLTIADIDAHASTPAKRRGRPAGSTAKSKARQSVKVKAASNGKLPAKYRDPKSGATWSGWARPPLWIKDVRDRSKFLIDDAADDGIAEKAVAKKASAKAGSKPATNKKVSRKSSARKIRSVMNQASANTSSTNGSDAA